MLGLVVAWRCGAGPDMGADRCELRAGAGVGSGSIFEADANPGQGISGARPSANDIHYSIATN